MALKNVLVKLCRQQKSPLDSCLTFLLTRFLIESHLLHFYLLANVIIACGYEGQPQKWGDLNPESGRLWRLIVEDCDFYTFIPKLRPLLAPDVFMKDHDKTRELLKNCFEYIYFYYFLYTKHSCYNFDLLADDIETEVRSVLHFIRSDF